MLDLMHGLEGKNLICTKMMNDKKEACNGSKSL